MPLIATGGGLDVSKGLQKYTWALYLSPASGAGVAPTAKLGANDPGAPWVRQGRLQADTFTWNVGAPSFLEGRAGFTQVLKFRVVNKAELPNLTAKMDEADPMVQARLRGSTASALSSGAYTGYGFIYQTGLFYAAKILLVGTSALGNALQGTPKEKHVVGLNAIVTFKNSADQTSETIDVDMTFLNDSSNNAFTVNEWD